MTIIEMLGQSALLTLLGMCVVFSFIIILIGSMKLLQLFVHATKLDQKDKPAESSGSSSAPAPVADDGAIVAAIAAAVHDKTLNS